MTRRTDVRGFVHGEGVLPIDLWAQYWIPFLVVGILPLVGLWALGVMAVTAPAAAPDRPMRRERAMARAPRWLRQISASAIPTVSPVGRQHCEVEKRYGPASRTVYESWRAVWAFPTALAGLIFVLATIQALWTSITLIGAPGSSWMILAVWVLAGAATVLIANETLKWRHWRRRATFEWQFYERAARALSTKRQVSGSLRASIVQRLVHVEELLESRVLDGGGESSRHMHDEWLAAVWWVSRSLASVRADTEDFEERTRAWIEEASGLVLRGRPSKWQTLRDAAARRQATSPAARPNGNARVLIVLLCVTAALLIMFALTWLTQGAVVPVWIASLPGWLETGAALCTIGTALVLMVASMIRRIARADPSHR